MNEHRWPSAEHIFFDCDSTLSSIEGIDELARLAGKADEVADLTDRAMNGELDLAEVYGERLRAITPTRGQLKAIEELYYDTLVPDAALVVAALHALGKAVYVVSGGLAEPVRGFARRLGVPSERVRAVELEYNALSAQWWRTYDPATRAQQAYLDYDQGPLTVSSGKPAVVRALAQGAHGRRVMVGDGASDLAARHEVDLFVGFGGVVPRAKVRAEAPLYITQPSLAAILPLAVGPGGRAQVGGTPYADVWARGLAHLHGGAVQFNDPHLQAAFTEAFRDA